MPENHYSDPSVAYLPPIVTAIKAAVPELREPLDLLDFYLLSASHSCQAPSANNLGNIAVSTCRTPAHNNVGLYEIDERRSRDQNLQDTTPTPLTQFAQLVFRALITLFQDIYEAKENQDLLEKFLRSGSIYHPDTDNPDKTVVKKIGEAAMGNLYYYSGMEILLSSEDVQAALQRVTDEHRRSIAESFESTENRLLFRSAVEQHRESTLAKLENMREQVSHKLAELAQQEQSLTDNMTFFREFGRRFGDFTRFSGKLNCLRDLQNKALEACSQINEKESQRMMDQVRRDLNSVAENIDEHKREIHRDYKGVTYSVVASCASRLEEVEEKLKRGSLYSSQWEVAESFSSMNEDTRSAIFKRMYNGLKDTIPKAINTYAEELEQSCETILERDLEKGHEFLKRFQAQNPDFKRSELESYGLATAVSQNLEKLYSSDFPTLLQTQVRTIQTEVLQIRTDLQELTEKIELHVVAVQAEHSEESRRQLRTDIDQFFKHEARLKALKTVLTAASERIVESGDLQWITAEMTRWQQRNATASRPGELAPRAAEAPLASSSQAGNGRLFPPTRQGNTPRAAAPNQGQASASNPREQRETSDDRKNSCVVM